MRWHSYDRIEAARVSSERRIPGIRQVTRPRDIRQRPLPATVKTGVEQLTNSDLYLLLMVASAVIAVVAVLLLLFRNK